MCNTCIACVFSDLSRCIVLITEHVFFFYMKRLFFRLSPHWLGRVMIAIFWPCSRYSMNKVMRVFQNTDAIILSVDCSVFEWFGRSLQTQRTVQLTLECSDRPKFSPLLETDAKSQFYLTQTALSSYQDNWTILFYSLSTNTAPISKTAASWTTICVKWSRHISLISSRCQMLLVSEFCMLRERICVLILFSGVTIFASNRNVQHHQYLYDCI